MFLIGSLFAGIQILNHFFDVPPSKDLLVILSLPGAILIWTAFSFPTVKRLHDINLPGWFFLLLLIHPLYRLFRTSFLDDVRIWVIEVPIVILSLVIFLTLAFKKGTNGQNIYGSDPLVGTDKFQNLKNNTLS